MAETTRERTEIKTKTCQSCGDSYAYPAAGSFATRFHCETCAALPEPARKALGRLATRVRKLEKELKKLQDARAG